MGQPGVVLAELRRPDLLQQAVLGGLGAKVSPKGHGLHVARTFALSYERLEVGEEVAGLARTVLARGACLATGQAIPKELWEEVADGEADETPVGAEALRREAGLQRLVELGLVERGGQGAVTVHRLVAAYAWEVSGGELAGHAAVVEAVVFAVASRVNVAGYPESLRAWAGHLRHVAETAEARGSEAAGGMWTELGYHFRMVGDYPGARLAYERALRIDEATLGPEHPKTQTTKQRLKGDIGPL